MKHLYTLILITFAFSAVAQTHQGIGVNFLINDYYSAQEGNKMTLYLKDSTTFSTWDPGMRISYWRTLSKWFDFSANLNLSNVDAPQSDSDGLFISRRFNNYNSALGYSPKKDYRKLLTELDLRLNLNFVDKDVHRFIPYIFSGVSGIILKDMGANVPVGAGINWIVGKNKKISINAEFSKKFAITGPPEVDRFQHTLGLVFWLHSKAKEVVPVVLDTDGDGINDDVDKCPLVAGLAAFGGCPDSDGDGIPDNEDNCPMVKGTTQYQGCPVPDTDGDGINDDQDKCPNEAGLAKYGGCPIPDTDADGFNDEVDKCPQIHSTTNNGCPVIKQEVIDRINKAASAIYFETGKAVLKKESNDDLDLIADELTLDKGLYCDIKGYTDNTGRPEKNLELSEQRAKVCFDYLVNKGIDPSRLTSKGYGDSDPVADNKTAAGRSKNRRTEFVIRNY